MSVLVAQDTHLSNREQERETIHQVIQERYGAIASGVADSCCSSDDCGCDSGTVQLYDEAMLAGLPVDVTGLSLGCGDPVTIAGLAPGEVVLDLGSGGGFDAFLAAQQVGPGGRVIGVDMTPSMVSKARSNADKANFGNVEFRLGEIEYLPVADATVDVIISNCVINLSPEKERVFRESFRVLRRGGRLAISDVVASAELPQDMKDVPYLHSACVAGASLIEDLEAMLVDAGFSDISIRPKEESREFIRDWAPGSRVEDYVVSATIEAVKA